MFCSLSTMSQQVDTFVVIPLHQFKEADKLIRKHDLCIKTVDSQEAELKQLYKSLASARQIIKNQDSQIENFKNISDLDKSVIDQQRKELAKTKLKAVIGGGGTAVVLIAALILTISSTK